MYKQRRHSHKHNKMCVCLHLYFDTIKVVFWHNIFGGHPIFFYQESKNQENDFNTRKLLSKRNKAIISVKANIILMLIKFNVISGYCQICQICKNIRRFTPWLQRTFGYFG